MLHYISNLMPVSITRLYFFLLLIIILPSATILAADPTIKTIVITQIVDHDSLNRVRDGIADKLKQRYHDQVNIEYSNANGNIVTASQIADKLASTAPNLIIAISTPSAQTVIKSAKNFNIPVLFATVTDPVGAKLVSSLNKPGSNVSGSRNVAPIKENLSLIKELTPNVKKLGVVLSSSEANSAFMLKNLKQIAQDYAIQIEEKLVINSNDVKSAAESLTGKVDAFFMLQDNIVASSAPSLIVSATKAGKPVFAAYLDAVRLGAIAAIAVDEYSVGEQTGEMAIRILEGAGISDMTVEDSKKVKLSLNHRSAKKLGIKLPHHIIKKYDSTL